MNESKEKFKDEAIIKIDKNFDRLLDYAFIKPKLFFELETPMRESYNCLMLDCYVASITMTNHILERLLKLAIIYKLALRKDNFAEVNDKYNKEYLGNNITKCYELNLLTEKEKENIMTIVRDVFRNGFSHADFGKILKDVSPEIQVMNFKGEMSSINRSSYRFISNIQSQAFAEKFAEKYYVYIYKLLHKIEERIDINSL
jgi:hypothetical protein